MHFFIMTIKLEILSWISWDGGRKKRQHKGFIQTSQTSLGGGQTHTRSSLRWYCYGKLHIEKPLFCFLQAKVTCFLFSSSNVKISVAVSLWLLTLLWSAFMRTNSSTEYMVSMPTGQRWWCEKKKAGFERFLWGAEADLSCRVDGASGHPDGVDASVGVFMNFDVGPLLSGLDVSCRIEQVQHLLVIQLESVSNQWKRKDRKTGKKSQIINIVFTAWSKVSIIITSQPHLLPSAASSPAVNRLLAAVGSWK